MSTMYFIGVTTGQSASLRMFPRWAEILGIGNARLQGIDLPLRSDRAAYRQVVQEIKDDPVSLGALITSHKLGVFAAAADLFDEVTADALQTQEISCIYKRNGRLIGHATDPTVSGRAMESLLQGHPPTEVLCFGAGGTGCAILTYFVVHCPPKNRPQRFVLAETSADQLGRAEELAERLPRPGFDIELMLTDLPERNDRLVEELADLSLVINATGMGKDLPGSPMSDKVAFPHRAVVWELNYRGELEFLRQARAQQRQRELIIEDGWHYFLLSWSLIVGLVFDVGVDEEVLRRFETVSER